eukprot:4995305-Alexandrium_andersonii.AAC.1
MRPVLGGASVAVKPPPSGAPDSAFFGAAPPQPAARATAAPEVRARRSPGIDASFAQVEDNGGGVR